MNAIACNFIFLIYSCICHAPMACDLESVHTTHTFTSRLRTIEYKFHFISTRFVLLVAKKYAIIRCTRAGGIASNFVNCRLVIRIDRCCMMFGHQMKQFVYFDSIDWGFVIRTLFLCTQTKKTNANFHMLFALLPIASPLFQVLMSSLCR